MRTACSCRLTLLLGIVTLFCCFSLPAGATPRQVTTDPDWERWADWSPDGAWLVYHAGAPTDFDVWKIAATGGEPPVPLTDGPYNYNLTPCWSPSGDEIVFTEKQFIAEATEEHWIDLEGTWYKVTAAATTDVYMLDDGINDPTEVQAGQIVISDDTRQNLPDTVPTRSLGTHTFRGIPRPVECYEVLGLGSTSNR